MTDLASAMWLNARFAAEEAFDGQEANARLYAARVEGMCQAMLLLHAPTDHDAVAADYYAKAIVDMLDGDGYWAFLDLQQSSAALGRYDMGDTDNA